MLASPERVPVLARAHTCLLPGLFSAVGAVRFAVVLLGVVGGHASWAGDVKVAVAANFAGVMQRIAADFAKDSGHTATLISGSTGKFHAQIKEGAPFELLLAADDETPRKLEAEGLALKGSRFTYAQGKLVLWSAQASYVDAQGEVLRKGQFEHLALANPQLAPYGAAAVEALKALGLHERLSSKFVLGDNIAQAHQFVATGNAQLGFVALSQVLAPTMAAPAKAATGSWWLVPQGLYTPIFQDAILLKTGQDSTAAKALMAYLQSDKARAVIRSWGYGLPP